MNLYRSSTIRCRVARDFSVFNLEFDFTRVMIEQYVPHNDDSDLITMDDRSVKIPTDEPIVFNLYFQLYYPNLRQTVLAIRVLVWQQQKYCKLPSQISLV